MENLDSPSIKIECGLFDKREKTDLSDYRFILGIDLDKILDFVNALPDLNDNQRRYLISKFKISILTFKNMFWDIESEFNHPVLTDYFRISMNIIELKDKIHIEIVPHFK